MSRLCFSKGSVSIPGMERFKVRRFKSGTNCIRLCLFRCTEGSNLVTGLG